MPLTGIKKIKVLLSVRYEYVRKVIGSFAAELAVVDADVSSGNGT